MIKKSICILVSIIMIISVISYAEDNDTSSIDTSDIELLRSLEIITETSLLTDASKILTRKEFVSLVSKLISTAYNLTNVKKEDIPFIDVELNTPYIADIMKAYNNKIISVNNEKLFRPDDDITREECIKILIDAIGYTKLAEISGGYPFGYSLQAYDIGVMKSVKEREDKKITLQLASKMIANSLEVEALKTVKISNGDVAYEKNKDVTILKDRFDIYKYTGVISANDTTSLKGYSVTSKNYISIDKELFNCNNNKAQDYLGYKVLAYYKLDEINDNKELLYISRTESYNEEIMITNHELSNVSDLFTIQYQKSDGNKTETVKLSKFVNVIYNGKELYNYTIQDLDISETSGYIKLIDNDMDNLFDTAYINVFNSFVVGEINQESNIILDKYNNNVLNLNPSLADYTYIIKRGKEILTFNDLKIWDILSVTETKSSQGKKHYTIYVSNKAVSGRITSKDENGIWVDDLYQRVSVLYSNLMIPLELNLVGVFYMDVLDEIVVADFSSSLIPQYAYLIKAALNQKGLSKEAEFKIFTTKNKVLFYKGADRINFNNQSLKAEKVIENLGANSNQLIKFEVDTNGKLYKLETAVDNTVNASNKGYDEDNFSLDRKLTSARFYRKVGAGYRITENTNIFYVPTNRLDDETYKVENFSRFPNEDTTINATIEFYDSNKFSQANIMVVKDFDKNIISGHVGQQTEELFFLVESVSTVLKEDGSEGLCLKGFLNGKKVSYFAKDNNVRNVPSYSSIGSGRMSNTIPNNRTRWGFTDKKITDVKTGDVLQLSLNGRDEIIDFRMIFSGSLPGISSPQIQPNNFFEVGEVDPTVDDPNFMQMQYTSYGEIIAVSGSSIRYKTKVYAVENGVLKSYDTERGLLTAGSYYKYYQSKNIVEKATAQDLFVGDRIFIHVPANECKHVMIIK